VFSQGVLEYDEGTDPYRIHTLFFNSNACIPTGGLAELVPVGVGFKFGSIFYFKKSGFSDGKFNIGLNATWLNIESNLPYTQMVREDNPVFSVAVTGNYGPTVTYRVSKYTFIDFYYLPGWGFRLVPNTKIYDEKYRYPKNPHFVFAQSVGASFRHKMVMAGLSFNTLSHSYTVNQSRFQGLSTIQVTIGVCGWKMGDED
jgi:hypothetical protein